MRGPIAIAVLVVLIFLGLNSVFVVDEREKALVLRFGEVQQVKTDEEMKKHGTNADVANCHPSARNAD